MAKVAKKVATEKPQINKTKNSEYKPAVSWDKASEFKFVPNDRTIAEQNGYPCSE